MKEIRKNLEILKTETAKLDNNDITLKIIETIDMLTDKVEEVLVNQEAIEENIKFIDTDISGIQEEIFEEVSFEDLEEIEDEYEEIKCRHCGKPIFIEKSATETNEKIKCPYCGENILK
ncbi:CD1247 N-terminal domain-containing protein [uncultured Clostridium sp.]|uniref:CD1247 N-terminal domain-containing protein n=1 Tax=uncultured Clostridium sp. TaxID=59620 RepID=UPI002619F40D|nr:CD1247 N-terminal domain-containing protein [uncultured Clostridium sp.]